MYKIFVRFLFKKNSNEGKILVLVELNFQYPLKNHLTILLDFFLEDDIGVN